LVGKERHDIGRPERGGYPIRGIRKGDFLYLRNFETDRWPGGNPETGYLNCDGGETKTQVLNLRRSGEATSFWKACFGKRPAEELYDVSSDPDCMNNLATSPQQAELLKQLRTQMEQELKAAGDPRMFGRGDVFDRYEYTSPATAGFYERFMAGEKLKAGWVSPSDFEPEPIR
ncbi:MAG: heparan N-sulfatase, partial [Planctomycetota bacterium]